MLVLLNVAIATFDWTLGGSIQRLSQQILQQQQQYRTGILPLEGLVLATTQGDTTGTGDDDGSSIITEEAVGLLQKQIDDAMTLLKKQKDYLSSIQVIKENVDDVLGFKSRNLPDIEK